MLVPENEKPREAIARPDLAISTGPARGARLFISTWTRSMRPSSNGTIPSFAESRSRLAGSRERGVVAAASYEARKFGVRSAMPSVTAKRKCPELIFVRPRFEVYRAVSHQIREIFAEYTRSDRAAFAR